MNGFNNKPWEFRSEDELHFTYGQHGLHAVHSGSYCWHVAFLDSPQFWQQSSGDSGGSGIADCMTLSRTLRMAVVNAAISASLFSDIQIT